MRVSFLVYVILTFWTISQVSSGNQRMDLTLHGFQNPDSYTRDLACCWFSHIIYGCQACTIKVYIEQEQPLVPIVKDSIFLSARVGKLFTVNPPVWKHWTYQDNPQITLKINIMSMADARRDGRFIDTFAHHEGTDIVSYICDPCMGFARVSKVEMRLRTLKLSMSDPYRTFSMSIRTLDFNTKKGSYGFCCAVEGVAYSSCYPCFHSIRFNMGTRLMFSRENYRANTVEKQLAKYVLSSSKPESFDCSRPSTLRIGIHEMENGAIVGTIELTLRDISPNHPYKISLATSTNGLLKLEGSLKYESLGYDGMCARSFCATKNNPITKCLDNGSYTCAHPLLGHPPYCDADTSLCMGGKRCKNNGTCKGNLVFFECTCPDGYSGYECEIPVCDQACVFGKCTSKNTCTCEKGWEGPTCSFPSCSGSSYCIGGECYVELLKKQCRCNAKSETGIYCQHKCLNPCVRGKCAVSGTLTYCVCDRGWTGYRCDLTVESTQRKVFGRSNSFFVQCTYISLTFVAIWIISCILTLYLIRKKKITAADPIARHTLQMGTRTLMQNTMTNATGTMPNFHATLLNDQAPKVNPPFNHERVGENNPGNDVYCAVEGGDVYSEAAPANWEKPKSTGGNQGNGGTDIDRIYTEGRDIYEDK